jgi:hypothetical protein
VPGSYACSRAFADGRALLLLRLLLRLCAGVGTCPQVGVLLIRGPADAFREFNETFATYLTCEIKCRYSPPVTFEMVPITFESMFSSVLSKAVDFLCVNPSADSCIESEFGASSLVSPDWVPENWPKSLRDSGIWRHHLRDGQPQRHQ